jgi:hypothetical protein
MPSNRTQADRQRRVAEVAEGRAQLLSPQDWDEVSSALGEMRDQLLEDLAGDDDLNCVFDGMVARLIDKLGNPDIASWPQARIYARSADPNHRERAALWMKPHHN